METFAFLIAITVAAPTGELQRVHVDESVIDSGLTLSDCLALWDSFEPTYGEGRGGLLVTVTPVCERES